MILSIHATNVTGLGACQVVVSLMMALDCMDLPFDQIICHIPNKGPLAEFSPKSATFEIRRMQRRGPKAVSRVMESLLPERFFDLGDAVIVLGDVPLRTRVPQVLLVHQPHLRSPAVNPHVGRSAIFRVMRWLTQFNSRYPQSVIVQTQAMADGLAKSYPNWADRNCIRVVGQPPPSWFRPSKTCKESNVNANGLVLFYPAAGYPHKNHRLFEELIRSGGSPAIGKLILTIPDEDFSDVPDWLDCVGRLNHEQCLAQYRAVDALVFPSVLESYGLPLVEAMAQGLPILASDLPYARVLCGDQGIYFDPDSADSLKQACERLKERISEGWCPDWSEALKDLPSNWSEVAQAFLEELK